MPTSLCPIRAVTRCTMNFRTNHSDTCMYRVNTVSKMRLMACECMHQCPVDASLRQRGSRARPHMLRTCISSPIGSPDLLVNTWSTVSTLYKKWGTGRRKDGGKQFAVRSGHIVPCAACGTDEAGIGPSGQPSAASYDSRPNAIALSNPHTCTAHMGSMSRGITDSVRRH